MQKLNIKFYLKAKEALSEGKSLRDVGFSKEETELIKNYNFLTLKPMIYVLNVGEEDISNDSELVKEVLEYAKKTNTETVKISAKIEDEISELPEEDRAMFLEELGIKESGLDQLVKKSYDLLGLATYFTAGEKRM